MIGLPELKVVIFVLVFSLLFIQIMIAIIGTKLANHYKVKSYMYAKDKVCSEIITMEDKLSKETEIDIKSYIDEMLRKELKVRNFTSNSTFLLMVIIQALAIAGIIFIR